ncbi:hypothetical protein DOY81_008277 [Sarcophaga bullata]|nr:hypothetical protein DOY81_008277 [Sarcophaga bullata]
MVLCKFFQQGNCRFNSKCVNEHFDVKQIIKTDVESAINGKQWPLSTYGPFKDKPSIPNFIEDQSFEEIRMLCYEAKQKNFFDQFHQQFTKEALDASNKMKALLQMTPDIIDVVIKVYDTPSDTSCSGATTGKPAGTAISNPFGATNAGSIFAKSNTVTGNSNIFGNATATAGGFGSSNAAGKSIFGATTNNNPTSSSIFGNNTPFGGQPQQQTSMFGQSTMTANSIFGGGTANNQQMNSIFGQQQPQTAPTMGANIFASATQQQQQQQPPHFGLFSQQNQQQPQQPSIFGQQKQPEPQNTNIFAQTPQAVQPQAGLFAQAAQTMQQPQQQPQGLFAQAAQQTAAQGQGLFAQAAQQTQSVFGQAMQQQPNTNIFQQQQQNNLGQQGQQQQIQNMQPPTGLFQQAVQQNQNSMNTPSPAQVSSTVYSRMEDLTAEEIEAFKADCFQPGKIPFHPPPRELIN